MLARAMAEQVEALGIGLHQPVLDPVVHHLHEMPGSDRPRMQIAEFGTGIGFLGAWGPRNGAEPRGERPEDGIEPRHHLRLAADHQAIAAFEPPHPARRPDIEIVDAARGEGGGAADIVLEVGVAAVNDHVARRPDLTEPLHRLFGDAAGGQHDPEGAGRRKERGESGERVRPLGAFPDERGDRPGVDVIDCHLMPRAHQPPRDVGAHPAQPHHPDLHGQSSSGSRGSGASGGMRRAPPRAARALRRNPPPRGGDGDARPAGRAPAAPCGRRAPGRGG